MIRDMTPEDRSAEQPAAGICPSAQDSIVFRDASGKWKGRYRDDAGHTQDVPLASHDGEHAQHSLANYLGVRPTWVRIVNLGKRY